MRAFLITPETQSITEVNIEGLGDIKALIGFDTIESDSVGTQGDRLYFDEECFLRGTSGRFQIDTVIPVAGKGVVAGTAEDGATLRDVAMAIEDLRQRIRYL
ncbi:MAG: hypothetical protein ACM3ST_06985 [Bdellovibrio bacteriovorus]